MRAPISSLLAMRPVRPGRLALVGALFGAAVGADNPGATCDEYEAAMRRIADELGL